MNTLVEKLKKRKHSVSFAESCTGGLLSSWITEIPGASQVFIGAVVAYANEVKKSLLSVSEETLKTEGAVSEAVALQMASGVKNKMKTTWGVAITGIAGPEGGTKRKPVGTVCFAVVGPDFELSQTQHFKGGRLEIQKQSAEYAAQLLENSLEGS